MRMNLDGTNVEEILQGISYGTSSWVGGATFDFNTRKIYWVDAARKILWQANLDGSNPEAFVRRRL